MVRADSELGPGRTYPRATRRGKWTPPPQPFERSDATTQWIARRVTFQSRPASGSDGGFEAGIPATALDDIAAIFCDLKDTGADPCEFNSK
jgi:hypothetical protein